MKNAVALIIILICLAGGILFYWKGCHTGPVPDRNPVDSILRLQHMRDSVAAGKLVKSQVAIDSLTRLSAFHQHRADSLGAALQSTGKELTAKAAAYRDLVDRGQDAADRKDTAAIVRNADTLRRDAITGLPLIPIYINLSDSARAEYVAQLVVKDSIISEENKQVITWADLNRHKDTTISIMETGYNKLYADDIRKTRLIKALKPAAIGGAAIVALDIVIHLLKK